MSTSTEIHGVDFDFKNLWLGINGNYKEILGPTMGEFSLTLPKKFDPPITYDVIVAEQGAGLETKYQKYRLTSFRVLMGVFNPIQVDVMICFSLDLVIGLLWKK